MFTGAALVQVHRRTGVVRGLDTSRLVQVIDRALIAGALDPHPPQHPAPSAPHTHPHPPAHEQAPHMFTLPPKGQARGGRGSRLRYDASPCMVINHFNIWRSIASNAPPQALSRRRMHHLLVQCVQLAATRGRR